MTRGPVPRRALAMVTLGGAATAVGALGAQRLPATFAAEPVAGARLGLLLAAVGAGGVVLAAAVGWGWRPVLRTLVVPARRFPRTCATLLGLVLALLATEVALRLLPAAPRVQEQRTGRHIGPDPVLGFRLLADASSRVVLRDRDGATRADAICTTDAMGRRTTPLPMPDGHRRAIAFLGCSITFGYGLADDATIPARCAARLSDAAVSNLACEGWGPHHALLLLRERAGALLPHLAEAPVAVFVWIDHHLDRLAGFHRVVSRAAAPWW